MRGAGEVPDLPPELADAAAERLFATDFADWPAATEALVAAHPAHAAALRRLGADLAAAERLFTTAAPPAGRDDAPQLGGLRVVRRLGEGAFGVVYLCEQLQPVQRFVAVKVLRPGAGDRSTLRRFAAERQLLAAQAHPAITQVFDAGELPDGRPFFVMEYVPGTDLRSYCEDRALPCADRVRLFLQVCHGVAHAHARGIVHRDLKPANVLVVDTEQGPRIKIIDFGIAKSVTSSDQSLTDTGRVLGTPGYMSPEQAAGRGRDVDGRTDVFSLGVMLYELLTGALPWARGSGAGDSEPPRPSIRVGAAARPTTTGTRRAIAATELRDDLDWIVLRAIARDPDDRYANVGALGGDLDRHLRGQPVSVGPPTVVYRLRKFVGRHRAAVAAALAGCLLAGGVWLASGRVDARATDAVAAVELLLQRANDERMRQLPANDALRQSLSRDALAFYDRWLVDRPSDVRLRRGRCSALVTLSQVHWQLGQAESALATANEAIDESRRLLAERPTDLAASALLADALRRAGRAHGAERRSTEARPLLAEAASLLEPCAAAAPNRHALSLAAVLRELAGNEVDNASRLRALERSVAVLEAALAASSAAGEQGATAHELARDLVLARCSVAELQGVLRQFDRAEAVLTKAAAAAAELSRDLDWLEVVTERTSGRLASLRGDTRGAVAALQRAVAAGERWCVAEPARYVPLDTLHVDLEALAVAANRAGEWDVADAAMARTEELAAGLIAQFPQSTHRIAAHYRSLRNFARLKWDRFRQDHLLGAEQLARRALAIHGRWEELEPQRKALRWEPLTFVADIRESRGEPVDDEWEAVCAALPERVDLEQPGVEDQIGGRLGTFRHHLRAGRLDRARAALDAAGLLLAKLPPRARGEVEHGRAQLALAEGDAAAAVAATERMRAAHDSWFTRGRAGDTLFLAAEMVDAQDAALAATHRRSAADLFLGVVGTLEDDVAKAPDDPWFVAPWGFAQVQLARLCAATEPDAARQHLARALPALGRVEAMADRVQWRRDVMQAGLDLQQRLGDGR